jgi:hypothetical protein
VALERRLPPHCSSTSTTDLAYDPELRDLAAHEGGPVYRALGIIFMILLFLGGVLALSNLIVSKRPDAKRIIDKLVPYQALIGVALLVIALWLMFRIGPINMFRGFEHDAVAALTFLGGVVSGIALGFFFGMPQIAAWIPGESAAETKAVALSRKLAPYTMMVGVVAVGAATLMLLYELKLLK